MRKSKIIKFCLALFLTCSLIMIIVGNGAKAKAQYTNAEVYTYQFKINPSFYYVNINDIGSNYLGESALSDYGVEIALRDYADGYATQSYVYYYYIYYHVINDSNISISFINRYEDECFIFTYNADNGFIRLLDMEDYGNEDITIYDFLAIITTLGFDVYRYYNGFTNSDYLFLKTFFYSDLFYTAPPYTISYTQQQLDLAVYNAEHNAKENGINEGKNEILNNYHDYGLWSTSDMEYTSTQNYENGYADGLVDASTDAFAYKNVLTSAFDSATSLMNTEVFPNITIGLILGLPLLLGLFLIVLKLIRG